MDISSQEGEIPIPISIHTQTPIPINSSYGHLHMIHHDPPPHHNHIILSPPPPPPPPTSSSALQMGQNPSNGPTPTNQEPYKKMVSYRECLKNHAASMGTNATDGCGEFMPSGEEGTMEALICSACNCHRNFHRKEVEGEIVPYNNSSSCECFSPHLNSSRGRKVILGHHHKNVLGPESLGYPRGPAHMMMSYNVGSMPSESDELEGCGGGGGGGGVVGRPLPPPPLPPPQMGKKRFRTKFTQEQKEKMLNFAEKVGWKFQRQEENVVQQFCQEIGVRRRVLKVWMHNNKHNLAKKNPSNSQNPI